MVIDPKLLDLVTTANPGFGRIKMTIAETVKGKKQTPLGVPAAGYLNEADTTKPRLVLHTYAQANFGAAAPIISLYTAGKMCQFWNTYLAGLKLALDQARGIFESKAKPAGLNPPYSAKFATLLGATLIDDRLTNALQTAGDRDVAKEFGIDPASGSEEWNTILGFASDPALPTTQNNLLAAPSWSPHCAQKVFFYAPFARAAN